MPNVFSAVPIDSLGKFQNIFFRFQDENQSEPRAANVRSGRRLSQFGAGDDVTAHGHILEGRQNGIWLTDCDTRAKAMASMPMSPVPHENPAASTGV